MQTSDRSATAFDKVAKMGDQREKLHALRFAYVKLHRVILDIRAASKELDRLTPEKEAELQEISDKAMFERNIAWHEIEALDASISLIMAQLNNGVYDEIRE